MGRYQRFKEKNKRDGYRGMSLADIIFESRLGLRWRDRKGRANEEGRRRGGRWWVKKASGGGLTCLKSRQATIMGPSAWPHSSARISCTLPRLAALRI